MKFKALSLSLLLFLLLGLFNPLFANVTFSPHSQWDGPPPLTWYSAYGNSITGAVNSELPIDYVNFANYEVSVFTASCSVQSNGWGGSCWFTQLEERPSGPYEQRLLLNFHCNPNCFSDPPPPDPDPDQCLEGVMNEECCQLTAENYCLNLGGVFSFEYFGIDAIGGERCEYVCFDDRPQEPDPDPDPDPNPEPTPNPIPDPINPEPEPDPNPVPEPPPESGDNQAVLHYLDILARQAKYDPRVYSELFRLNRNSQLNAEELHRLTNETNERLANNGIILDNVLDELVKANDRGELVLPSDGELDDSLLDWRLDGISDLSPNIVSNWDYFRGSARSLLVEAGLNPDDAEFDVDDWELDVIDISERADDFDLFLPDASCIGVKMYDINGLMFPINWTPLCDIFHWVGMLVVFSAWFSTPFIVFNTSKK